MSEQATTNTEATHNETAVTQLQLADLLLCAQALQLASQRGAFRAEEFTQVGGVFDRITAFLKESGALQSAPTAEAAEQSPAE